jgi:hypothetical protein
MITIPETIEIRKTPEKAAFENTERILRDFFNSGNLTLNDAGYIYTTFFGKNMRGKFKEEKFENSIQDFLFTETGSFEKWFFARPEISRRILYAIVFEVFAGIENLEKALKQEIVLKKDRWRFDRKLDPSYNLDFLVVYDSEGKDDASYQKKNIGISELYRAAILPHFVPPPEALLENCISPETPAGMAYNNSADIPETVPLFCGVLNDIIAEDAEPETLGQGFNKKTIGKMYAASGLRPFPFETEKALAACSPAQADMMGRFMLYSMNFLRFARPEKPVELMRAFFKQFLTGKNDGKLIYYGYRDTLEYNMFFGHISKNYSGSRFYTPLDSNPGTPVRRTLQECLLAIAKDGRTFDAHALVKQLKYSGKTIAFFPKRELENFRLKADTVQIDGNTIEKSAWGHITPFARLRFYFIEKPLFLGYFYLCASLGILEITQAPPPLICERGGN